MALKYFTVKLVIKSIITGAPIPERIDEFYNDDVDFYEESLYLVQARSAQKAFLVAEKAALGYMGEPYTNRYGQKVEQKIVSLIDCYCLSDKPTKELPEVYSHIYMVPNTKTEAQFLKEKYDYELHDIKADEEYDKRQIEKQHVLLNEEFSAWVKKLK